MLNLSDIKTGKTIIMDDEPYRITWNQFSKTARQGGVMKTKMKNLITGKVVEQTFQGSDRVEEAEIQYRRAQFLYQAGEQFDFMDQESFETFPFTAEQLGDQANYLSEGIDVDIQYFNGKPINIMLPAKMTFRVVQCEPGVKGNTATGATKNATIETGYEIKVPLFINQDDLVVLNTLTGEYVERGK
ncbi:elongation factor P [Candidatus Peribacteria bacterium]|nr:elongation factor P [Candidatus Peribacteria bacterium]